MGIAERKEREKLEMREKILLAATELFVEKGYDETSIRTIAERIEYSPATIYLYFKDKPELFHAIMDQAFQTLLERFRKNCTLENPLDRLRQLGQEYLRFAAEHPALYDLMFIMRKPMDHIHEPKDWDCGFQTFYVLQGIMQQCIDEKLVRFTNAEVASLTVWSHLHGLIALHVRGRMLMMPENLQPYLIQQSIEDILRIIRV